MIETGTGVESLAANVVRGLAIDAIEEVGGGHPGMPLGMADVATILWTRFLRHDPAVPDWPDRDRYVQSAGHGSMLLYALLHLSGYDLPIDELRNHRQLHSRTPGHPEYGRTAGVETTTGPLGQGFANAVGMALAEAMLAARYNRPGHAVVDHRTWTIVGDGDLEEGISHEAATFASHLRLAKLTVLFDDNRVTIDGPTSVSTSEDTLERFRAYGWHVQQVDGHDPVAIDAAIRAAVAEMDRPSFVACRTIIGRGSPNRQATSAAHSSALGPEEAALTRRALGLPADERFWVPDSVRAYFAAVAETGAARRADWESRREQYAHAFPAEGAELERTLDGGLPDGWDQALPRWDAGAQLTPKSASHMVVTALAPLLPELVGGSADLSESNETQADGAVPIEPGAFSGRYIRYGIREAAMAGVMNGMALHRGLVPYSGTYLPFADYMRPSIRLAALMGLHVIYVWTHDSVTVGEDGPTHQSVEHIASLRCVPGLVTFRPADANEVAAAWRYALTHRDRPIALFLSKQPLPVQPVAPEQVRDGVARGAYVMADAASGTPDVLLLATGSEVSVAMDARERLANEGIAARVVSMPSWRLFEEQDIGYRRSVLPAEVRRRVSIEAGVTFGWDRYIGEHGIAIGIDRFGECGKPEDVLRFFGITPDAVVDAARSLVKA
jgi:transketolase